MSEVIAAKIFWCRRRFGTVETLELVDASPVNLQMINDAEGKQLNSNLVESVNLEHVSVRSLGSKMRSVSSTILDLVSMVNWGWWKSSRVELDHRFGPVSVFLVSSKVTSKRFIFRN